MNHCTRRNDCRLCNSTKLDLVLPILPSAIGDAFVSKSELDQIQDRYPLDTYLCLECGHLQNLDIVDPDILFRNYTYKTSASVGLVEHFKAYADSMVAEFMPLKNSLVVEVGSNDGSLLKAFKKHELQVLGIDPARQIAATATSEGIPTIPEFFNEHIGEKIAHDYGKATFVCANNVFAHVDNIENIVKGIKHILTPDGVFVFEVSYVLDMLDNFVFDTIYHEHLSHHALIPLERFFNRLGLTLFDIKRVQSKGGSIRGFAQLITPNQRDKSQVLIDMLKEEENRNILQPYVYRNFFIDIEYRKKQVLTYLDQAKSAGKTIAAYGASTTTTTLLYHFELGSRISYIVDDNPIKQGLYSPGWHIPVVSRSEMTKRNPDIVIILAWVYSDLIVRNNSEFLRQGGEFLIPLPNVKIINRQNIVATAVATV